MDHKKERPTLEQVFLHMAKTIAERSTCLHRNQGAILVKDNHIISAGYNGSPPGQFHCTELGYCSKEQGLPCMAEGLHGESNAVTTAARFGISTADSVLYSVYSPCRTCCNILKVAGIVEVVYTEVYSGFLDGPKYLEEIGIPCRQTNLI